MHSNHWLSLATAPQFCMWNKQTSIIFRSHSHFCLSFNFLPPFTPSSFSGARSSHQLWWGLHGGLSLIAGELKEAGWLRQPSITSLLPHFSLPTSPTEYRLSGLHLAAPRWRVFCSPCAPVICPTPRPASSLKDYILGRDLNYTACPPCTQHPSHHISAPRWESGAVVLQLSLSPLTSAVSG